MNETEKQKTIELFHKILRNCEENNYKLLYCVVTGSHAYGLNTETSDIDIKFVFAANAKTYLGFGGSDSLPIEGNDIFGYELKKYVNLCLAGNPTTLEMLFSDEKFILFEDDSFKNLRENRKKLLGKHCFNSFSKYAENQVKKSTLTTREVVEELESLESALVANNISLEKLEVNQTIRSHEDITGVFTTVGDLIDKYKEFKRKRFPYSNLGTKRKELIKLHGFDTKNIAHAFRLMGACVEILEQSNLTVYRPDIKDMYLDVRNGRSDKDVINECLQKVVELAKRALEKCTLAENPDRDLFETITIDIIRNSI